MRALTLGSATLAVLMTTGCVSKAQYQALEKTYTEQRSHSQAIQATNDRLDAENEGMRLSVDALKRALDKRDTELQVQRRQIGKLEAQYKEQLERLNGKLGATREAWNGERSAWADKMSAIASQQGSGMKVEGNKVTLDASVFFKAGSSDVTESTQRIILQVASALKGSDTKIHIVGHTDSDPIVKAKARFPKGNWQLSGERAMSVLQLMEANSIRKNLLSFEGRGDTQPVAPNDSTANKAKNRRVEIYLRD